MRTMTYKMILGLILLGLIGCGEGRSSTTTETEELNGPKSPVLNEKEKSPPSIPNI